MSVERFDIYSSSNGKSFTKDGEFADGEVAQELYDALDGLLGEYMATLQSNYCQCDQDYEVTDKARAALAKARGEK